MHGSVRRAFDARTGERVAVKIVPREERRRLGEPALAGEKVRREIAVMKKAVHRNVVQLKEVIDDPRSQKIFLVLELMEGGEVVWKDLFDRPAMTVNEAQRTLRDVVLGLEFLHYQGIIHRDIKPANLLWTHDHTVKISDFGTSYLGACDMSSATDATLAKTAGSPAFFAPELCTAAPDAPPVTKAIDVWALGVTLYCLLFGHVPFMAPTEYILFQVILEEDYALPAVMGTDAVPIGPRPPRWPSPRNAAIMPDEPAPNDAVPPLGTWARDLLDRLLDKDPRTRISLSEVKQHPFVTGDLANASQWLARTDVTQRASVHVSREEVDTAGTPAHTRRLRLAPSIHVAPSLSGAARWFQGVPLVRAMSQPDAIHGGGVATRGGNLVRDASSMTSSALPAASSPPPPDALPAVPTDYVPPSFLTPSELARPPGAVTVATCADDISSDELSS